MASVTSAAARRGARRARGRGTRLCPALPFVRSHSRCGQHLALVPRLGRRAGRRRDLSGLFLRGGGEPRSPRLQVPPEGGRAGGRGPEPGAREGAAAFAVPTSVARGSASRRVRGVRRPISRPRPGRGRGRGRGRDREQPWAGGWPAPAARAPRTCAAPSSRSPLSFPARHRSSWLPLSATRVLGLLLPSPSVRPRGRAARGG